MANASKDHKNEEKKDATGLSTVEPADRKAEEYELLTNLLEASNFKRDENEITEVEIRRSGKYMFSVHVHPIGEEESQRAHRKAVKKKKNRRGQLVASDDIDTQLKNSWLIYLATTDEDKKRIWGNPEFMAEKDILDPVDSIDMLLKVGEKVQLINTIFEISGWADDDEEDEYMSDEEYAKN